MVRPLYANLSNVQFKIIIYRQETIQCVPDAAVVPLGIVFQDTIDEFENVKEKVCATHNQYFPFLSGMSVNDCVVEDKLAHCQYSHDALYCGCLTSITSSLHLSW